MGLFQKDYNRPGKGVLKNEPEKKSFFRFFELYFRNFWMFVSAELWYILLFIPIVTSGFANVGLAYVCRMAARDKHVFPVSDFFSAIKKNWKRALPLGIINAFVTAVFAADMWCLYLLWKSNPERHTLCLVILIVSLFLYLLYTFAKFYQYTLMITFDYDLKAIIKNSWLFATLGIKHNIIIGGTLLLIYIALLWFFVLNVKLGTIIAIVFGLFILPAFRMFLIQFNVFPEIKKYIIDPYYKEHPDADIEKRRDLGLIDAGESESVFDDEAERKDDNL